tara:strand:+ start:759 stop:899 length:141 start_codon:yes stop_codon:yes gene_type:complete
MEVEMKAMQTTNHQAAGADGKPDRAPRGQRESQGRGCARPANEGKI